MWKIILTVCIIVVIIAVVLIPYLKHPKITEETKKNLGEKFYGGSAIGRAGENHTGKWGSFGGADA